jgi:dihydroceramidase
MAGGEFSKLIRRHIFTGLSVYYVLTWGVWLRYCQKHQQDDVIVIWPSLFTSVPVVVKKQSLLDKKSKKLK